MYGFVYPIWSRWAPTLTIACLVGLPTQAKSEGDASVPPVAGRPWNFSGAIGSFSIQTRATPTSVLAEDPVIFTVRIRGDGSLKDIERPDLRKLPTFAKRFQIDNLSGRDLPSEKAHEFDYRLRPRGTEVKQIPPMPFVFFKPGFIPEYRGYQTTYAPAIPLEVKPRGTVQAADVQGAPLLNGIPDLAYEIAEGPAVLRHTTTFSLPHPLVLCFSSLLPPVMCFGWYLLWRRRHPNDVRLARQRRTRAARQALKALDDAGRLPAHDGALRSEQVVVDYLRGRLNLSIAEPTPAEVALLLQQAGSPSPLSNLAEQFFLSCDAVRFAPVPSVELGNLPTIAKDLVQRLEDQPCRW